MELTGKLRAFNRRFGWPLRIALLVGVVALVLVKIDRQAFIDAMHPASWGFVLAAVAANALSVVFKGLPGKEWSTGSPACAAKPRSAIW